MIKKIIRQNKEFLSLVQTIKCVAVNTWQGTSLPHFFKKKEDFLAIERNFSETYRPEIPKIIWIYWHEETIPLFIKDIINHNERLNREYDLRCINKITVRKHLPNLEEFNKDLEFAHIADLVRLELLYHYGGIWIDATVILRNNLDWVIELSKKRKYDIIGYYREKSTVDFKFPIIETWFLASYPRSNFFKEWLDYFKPINVLGSKVYYDRLKERSDYDIIKQELSNPSYLMLNLVEQIVNREISPSNTFLKKSEDSAFYLQEYYGWNNYKMNYVLCRLENFLENIPIIKLTSGDRLLVARFRQLGWVKKNSMVAKLQENNVINK